MDAELQRRKEALLRGVLDDSVGASPTPPQRPVAAGNGASALSDDARAAVLKQVHYYFSDGNLQRDSFMRDKIAESAEGWVALDLINRFNRMRRMGLTVSDLVEVLRTSDELSIDAGGGRVRRHAPSPQAVQQAGSV